GPVPEAGGLGGRSTGSKIHRCLGLATKPCWERRKATRVPLAVQLHQPQRNSQFRLILRRKIFSPVECEKVPRLRMLFALFGFATFAGSFCSRRLLSPETLQGVVYYEDHDESILSRSADVGGVGNNRRGG